MKRRITLLIGLLVFGAFAAGCGKKDDAAEAAPTPSPTIETSGQQTGNVVSMQQSTGIDKSRITNIMGTKSGTSRELVITNNTGFEIESFYVRPANADEWGEDLIGGRFTLKDKDQALCYYEPDEKDEDGETVTKWDLRVSYTDEDESDCLFRNLTLTDIEELKLNMEDGVPFVTYTSLSTKRLISTLEEAKARMGMTDDSDDSDEDKQGSHTSGSTPAPSDDSDDSSYSSSPNGNDSDDSDIPDSPGGGSDRTLAESYIGQSYDSLAGELGSGYGFDSDENPEDGSRNGYHYYDGYTVYTKVDEDGNETVSDIQ